MKSFKIMELTINPFYRDVVLVLLAGIFVSAALVTLGYAILLAQS
ncbi:MAG TPA: hypothetical protein PLX35_13955 [Cyclobacteriaceae bacterium]|nr:hypothetical protein [Cyclobacteriaceae bacterium]